MNRLHGVRGMTHGAKKIMLRIGTSAQILIVALVLLAPSGLFGKTWKPVDIYPSDKNMKIEMDKKQALLLADQHQNSTPSTGSDTSTEESAMESRQKTETGKTPARPQKKKPSKPFRPSERITADQAVDFPSDI